MSPVNRLFLKKSRTLLLSFFLFSMGCAGGAVEGQPVSLPVPFSGALTPDSRVVVSNGDPISGGPALSLREAITKSSDVISWNFFNSDGSHAGQVIFGSKTPQNLKKNGNVTTFSVPITFLFDDGCTVASSQVNYFDFDYPIGAPNDPTVSQTKGVCSGYITQGTCSFASAIGKLIDCRYVYQSKIVEGQPFFNKINWGPWIIQR
jgi:hypothetical protein